MLIFIAYMTTILAIVWVISLHLLLRAMTNLPQRSPPPPYSRSPSPEPANLGWGQPDNAGWPIDDAVALWNAPPTPPNSP